MRLHSTRALAALVTALALLVGTSGASANRLSMSESSFEMVWESITFTIEGGMGGPECALTLSGSFHSRTLSKTTGLLVGLVPDRQLEPEECDNGGNARIAVLPGLAWHLRYRSFSGTLPTVASVSFDVVGAEFGWDLNGIQCLASVTQEQPLPLTATVARGVLVDVSTDEDTEIPMHDAGPESICDLAAPDMEAIGTGTIGDGSGGALALGLI